MSERRPEEHPPEQEPEELAAAGAPEEDAGASTGQAGDQAEVVEADFEALLEDTRRERDEYLEIARRARADFENFRKRASREAADAERRGKASVAGELLPAIDSLERAILAAGLDPNGEPSGGEEGAEALSSGVLLVYRELRDALERAGVESFDPAGEPFDPNQHEALQTRPAGEEGHSGTVLETLQRGYRLDGHVLRAARVVVGD